MSKKLLPHKNEDLEKVPFSIKANPNVIGRVKEKELLIKFIRNGDICFLTGPTGTGKSSLLLWLTENSKTYNTFYIDAANIEKDFSIKNVLKSSRRGFDRFREYPTNTVVLLDESQDCDAELQKALKLHWDHNHIKSIVVTQIDPNLENFSVSFNDRIGNRIMKLGKINKSDAIELIKQRCADKTLFDIKAMEEIAKKTNYTPRKILELCESLYLETNGKTKLGLSDVKKIFKKNKTPKKRKEDIQETKEPDSILYIQQEKQNKECPKEHPETPQQDRVYEINDPTNKRLTLTQKKIVSALEDGQTTAKKIAEILEMPLDVVENELEFLYENRVLTINNP